MSVIGSVADPEWFIPDPDPALNFPSSGSMRIRIRNTGFRGNVVNLEDMLKDIACQLSLAMLNFFFSNRTPFASDLWYFLPVWIRIPLEIWIRFHKIMNMDPIGIRMHNTDFTAVECCLVAFCSTAVDVWCFLFTWRCKYILDNCRKGASKGNKHRIHEVKKMIKDMKVS